MKHVKPGYDLVVKEIEELSLTTKLKLLEELKELRPVTFVAVTFNDEQGEFCISTYKDRALESGPIRERFLPTELCQLLCAVK